MQRWNRRWILLPKALMTTMPTPIHSQRQRLKWTRGLRWRRRASATKVLSELLCPLTLEVMRDPVIAADGHTVYIRIPVVSS